MTLTKSHIFEAVAKQNGYPKNQSFELIETLLEIISTRNEKIPLCTVSTDVGVGRNRQMFSMETYADII
jgi:hypothetical protein